MLRMKLEHEYLNGILLTRANDITYINAIDLKEGYITKVKLHEFSRMQIKYVR